jgi:hypothetical protein
MNQAKYATYMGERIARRQARPGEPPHLVTCSRPRATRTIGEAA